MRDTAGTPHVSPIWQLTAALLSMVAEKFWEVLKTLSQKSLLPCPLGQCQFYAGSLTSFMWLSSSYFDLIKHPSLAILSSSHFSALLPMPLGNHQINSLKSLGLLLGRPRLSTYPTMIIMHVGQCLCLAQTVLETVKAKHRASMETTLDTVIMSHWEARWGEAGSVVSALQGLWEESKSNNLALLSISKQNILPLLLLNLSHLAIESSWPNKNRLPFLWLEFRNK